MPVLWEFLGDALVLKYVGNPSTQERRDAIATAVRNPAFRAGLGMVFDLRERAEWAVSLTSLGFRPRFALIGDPAIRHGAGGRSVDGGARPNGDCRDAGGRTRLGGRIGPGGAPAVSSVAGPGGATAYVAHGSAHTLSIHSSCPPMRKVCTGPTSSSVPVLPLVGGGRGVVATATVTPAIGVGAAASSPA